MSWIEVKARVTPFPADPSPIIDAFRDHGIENTLEDPDAITGCLVDVPGSEARLAELTAALENLGAIVTSRDLVEDNWEIAWRQFFKPRRVGNRFVIRPTWEEFAALPGDRVIVLDPGQAFGTGDHPTTRMCLELLEELDLTDRTVADIGCGSGILAVGAVLLGAGKVDAVDIDPIAVEVAKENAALNGVTFRAVAGEGVRALEADPASAPQDETKLTDEQRRWDGRSGGHSVETYDLVVSNIISATLIRIAHDVARSVSPGGAWIVSGIIEANWPDVRAEAERAGFDLVGQRAEDGWVAARFRRSSVE